MADAKPDSRPLPVQQISVAVGDGEEVPNFIDEDDLDQSFLSGGYQVPVGIFSADEHLRFGSQFGLNLPVVLPQSLNKILLVKGKEIAGKLQKRRLLAAQLDKESKLVSEESLSVLAEFEAFEDEDQAI